MSSSVITKTKSNVDLPVKIPARLKSEEGCKNQSISSPPDPTPPPKNNPIVQPLATYPNSAVGHMKYDSRTDCFMTKPAISVSTESDIPEVKSAKPRSVPSLHIQKALEALQTQYDALTSKFAKQHRDLQSSKSENAALKNKVSKMEVDQRLESKRKEAEMNEHHQKAYNTLEKRATQHSDEQKRTIQALREKNMSLKAEVEKLRSQPATIAHKHKHADADAMNKINGRTLMAKTGFLDAKDLQIASLDKKICALKEERDEKEPLVHIGIAIRLRFFEQKRMSHEGLDRDELRSEVIDKGNNAAHGLNEVADASVFKHALIPEENRLEYQDIFRTMYQQSDNGKRQTGRRTRGEKVQRAKSLRATFIRRSDYVRFSRAGKEISCFGHCARDF